MNRRRKARERVCRDQKVNGKDLLCCSLSDTRADKKGRRRWPLFLRAACTNPSITKPHSSSITHPTRPRLRTWPVVDFPPDPSSIADPTRPRLPTRPVLDHPFDPSLIYRTDRSTITDPHPWFYPARVFQNFYFCVGRVCRSCPGVNQGINKSIMCPDRRAMVNNNKNLVIPYLGRPCFSYYTCNALT
jgi:hypothetical protein